MTSASAPSSPAATSFAYLALTLAHRRSFIGACAAGLFAVWGCAPSQVSESSAACAGAASSPWAQRRDASLDAQLAVDRQGHLLAFGAGTLQNLDDRGEVRWTTNVDGWGGGIAVTGPGDILTATSVAGTQATDPALRRGGAPRGRGLATRLDSSGSRLWSSFVDDGSGDLVSKFVGEAPNGDVLLAGNIAFDLAPSPVPNTPGTFGFFAARLTSSGELLWEHHWDPQSFVSRERGFVVDAQGRLGVIVWVQVGIPLKIDDLNLEPLHTNFTGYLVWFGEDGRAEQAIDVTEDGAERFNGVTVDAQGRLYVYGFIGSDGQPGSYTEDLVIAGVEPSGQHVWAQRFRFTDQSEEARAAVDSCGDVLFIGNGHAIAGGFLAARLSRDGVVKTQVNVPASVGSWALSVAPAPGGMYVDGAAGDNLQQGFLARLRL